MDADWVSVSLPTSSLANLLLIGTPIPPALAFSATGEVATAGPVARMPSFAFGTDREVDPAVTVAGVAWVTRGFPPPSGSRMISPVESRRALLTAFPIDLICAGVAISGSVVY